MFRLEILTDQYGSETSWTLQYGSNTEAGGGPEYGADSEYKKSMCIPNGEHSFEIADSYGDGMCCGYGNGYFKVFYDGSLVAEGGEAATNIK